MKRRWLQRPTPWKRVLGGALLSAALGLLLFLTSAGKELEQLAYDALFLLEKKRGQPEEVVLVYLDDESFRALKQTAINTWNRNLHAALVDRMTADGARLVVFDIVFTDPGEPSANTNFARAMRQNGRVVLAASRAELARRGAHANSAILPLDLFRDNAAWGITGVYELDVIKRKYYVGDAFLPSLPWVAAQVADVPGTRQPQRRQPDWLLNFYGPALWLPHVGYSEVASLPAGFFKDKCVFVGARPKTPRAFDEADLFPTPYWRWGGSLFPGVEIGATAFLNIARGDGVVPMANLPQFAILLAAGLILGGLLSALRPWFAVAAGALAGLAFVVVPLEAQVWMAWPVVVLVQIPAALAWALGGHVLRLALDREVLRRTLDETTKLVEATKLTAQPPGQLVPDHELLRLVGKGAYGEVWLARNAVGVLHAVKIVRRAAFPSDVPYEREFKGIQRFMPVSRSHPGFVHLLHVGRNQAERCFYCIMEAGDDQVTGQRIDPEKYVPNRWLPNWRRGGSFLRGKPCASVSR